jgi:hypothetical protein
VPSSSTSKRRPVGLNELGLHISAKALLESSSPECGKPIRDGWTNTINALPSQHVA